MPVLPGLTRWAVRAAVGVWLLATALPTSGAVPGPVLLDPAMQDVDVTDHVAYLEDPSGALDLDDLRSPEWRERLQPPPDGDLEFGFSSSAWWLRIELENPGSEDGEWILEIGAPQADRVDAYLPGRAGDSPLRMGDSVPLEQRPMPLNHAAFPLSLSAGERQVLWTRVESTSVISLPVMVSGSAAYTGVLRERYWGLGFVVGALGALLLYNLVVFLVVRQALYLHYIVQTAFSIGYTLAVTGYTSQLLPGTGRLQSIIAPGMALGVCYFGVRFAREFLDTRRATPRADRAMRAYEWLVLATVAALLAAPILLATNLVSVCVLLLGGLLSVTAVARFPTASPSMRIYLSGLGLIMSVIFLSGLSTFGIGLALAPALGLLRFGFLAERGFAAVALATRIRELEGEAEAAASGQRHAEAALEETEERLRHSQKMEAVGTLAGGIAHDFNNLLQAILGYTDMALSRVRPGEPIQGDLNEVRESGQRAATLTRQLLAFSRRQVLQTADVDLNQLVARHLRLTERLLGADVTVEFEPAEAEVVVHADPAQLEQVLLNLCLNARDAMPEGGRLMLSTRVRSAAELQRARRTPDSGADHVELVVADTGTGIEPEAKEHLFEPFFTTKEPGRGTGLGLAMVYGTVRQHEGFIEVDSPPEGGSVFRIFLPLVTRPASALTERPESEVGGGDECLLVAEDDPQVRALTAQMLTAAGYRVLACEDGREALQLLESHRSEIQLAVLDLVMPELGGRKVAEEIRREAPDLPVVFCTGRGSEAVESGFSLDSRTRLVRKPYRREDLLLAVRQALEA